jgi:FkbM family methyltransferase
MTTRHRRLSAMERCAHAIRVGAALKVPVALADAAGRAVAFRWWSQNVPWYVGRVLQRLGRPTTLDGARFRVDPPQFAGLLWLGAYETAERFAVARYLPPDVPVIELGASIGVVSCLIDRVLHDGVVQIAVEANPMLIPTLERHRGDNGADFRVVHAALAYGGGDVEFQVSDSSVAGALGNAPNVTHTVKVPTTTLEAMLRDHAVERCSLVCDIEGAEVEMIRREADVLRGRVHTIIMEVHPDLTGIAAVEELFATLSAAGFERRWQRGDVVVLANRALAA